MDISSDGDPRQERIASDLSTMKQVVDRQEEVMLRVVEVQKRIGALEESAVGAPDWEEGTDTGKGSDDMSDHDYEMVDGREFLKPKGGDVNHGEGKGEEDALVRRCIASHHEVEARLRALETRVDLLERRREGHEAGATNGDNSSQRLPMGLSSSLSELDSISEAIYEEDEGSSASIASETIGPEPPARESKHKTTPTTHKKRHLYILKGRSASEGCLSDSEGFHEKMAHKMAHVTAKLGKIARVSRSVKTGHGKEDAKKSDQVKGVGKLLSHKSKFLHLSQ